MKLKLLGALATVLLIGPMAAHATLLGATVNVSAYYPTVGNLYQAGPDVVVSNAIEYPMGTFGSYNPSWQIDITDTQIRITNTGGTGFPYLNAAFNGWVLTMVSGPAITGGSVAVGSQFNPNSITLVGNQLFLNYQGVTGEGTLTSIIDIRTGASVPEPGTLALLGAGLLGVFFARRRKRD